MIKWLRSTVALLSPVGTKAKRNKTGGEGRGEDQKKLWLREKENWGEKQSSKFKEAERKVT